MAKSGTRQSPVDIVPTSCSPDSSLGDLKYQYTPTMIKLINTGSSWRMDFSPDGSNLSGGPLGDDYKVSPGCQDLTLYDCAQVLQMHAHWGDKPGRGSEHTLDGKMFDAELHIVHYNSKYGDPSVAVDKPDGLAVLGMFIKTGKPHPEFEKLCHNLKHIESKDATLQLQETLDPANCLPSKHIRTSVKVFNYSTRQQNLLHLPRLSDHPTPV